MKTLLLLVIVLPLLGAVLNGLILRQASKKTSHLVGSGVLVAAFLCALAAFFKMLGGDEGQIVYVMDWLQAGSFVAPFELVMDPLSGMMLLIITGIGSLIHIYAGGYMHHEKETWRFFSYLNLFVFMMLLLVLGNNLLIMFVGWEGVGLCSYLLIGYWYEEDENAGAGVKAFLVNRIGDIGFLIGIFLCYAYFGTVSFSGLREIIGDGSALTGIQLTAIGGITLALFIGATGKSAQIPLYVWLPDAMAGPTPVSALIHAATMVTAGIYMMTRMSFMYYLAPDTMTIVAGIGAATALLAATIALVQNDIKKVLAYSTVSQLGYMVLACGVGAFSAGAFHLFTHACFKALLFMGAGSVIVAMHHKQDMREMGGLRSYLPWTHKVFTCGVLAIIGFPLTSGFFSKDEILWKAYIGGGPVIWAVAALAACCTAFYMIRLWRLTFYGDCRADSHTKEHLHETSPVMWAPLVVLAVLSLVVGFLNVPHIFPLLPHQIFDHYLAPVVAIPEAAQTHWAFLSAHHSAALEWGLMAVSVAGMIVAWLLADRLYRNGPSDLAADLKDRFAGIHEMLANKYWIDEFYFASIVKPLKEMSYFAWKVVDTLIIDGIVNGVGQVCTLAGGLISFRSTGSMHRHAMVLMLGLICLLSTLLFI